MNAMMGSIFQAEVGVGSRTNILRLELESYAEKAGIHSQLRPYRDIYGQLIKPTEFFKTARIMVFQRTILPPYPENQPVEIFALSEAFYLSHGFFFMNPWTRKVEGLKPGRVPEGTKIALLTLTKGQSGATRTMGVVVNRNQITLTSPDLH